ncbi:GatB/YqeY domain-containing protein [Moraxella sp.]|uniref:GatB/YqeY domain-containing protein n=1 Tax=Moraxella sp. TaxID=479 RepID=UPI0026DB4F0B|nr:GatB/YqeY domain-containing protein [Moraxella sp.]MDO4894038.1 GatB/YqeY domain-containing protein [Moraxella sp.]
MTDNSLKSALTEAVKNAMKAKEMDKVKVLRNVQAAIKQIEIDEQVELDDKAVLAILQKQIKQRQESLQIYQTNGREDLAAQESFEIQIISQFLPAQLDESALNDIIAATISQLNADGMKDMGKVMNAVKEQTVGQADPAIISALVKKALTA